MRERNQKNWKVILSTALSAGSLMSFSASAELRPGYHELSSTELNQLVKKFNVDVQKNIPVTSNEDRLVVTGKLPQSDTCMPSLIINEDSRCSSGPGIQILVQESYAQCAKNLPRSSPDSSWANLSDEPGAMMIEAARLKSGEIQLVHEDLSQDEASPNRLVCESLGKTFTSKADVIAARAKVQADKKDKDLESKHAKIDRAKKILKEANSAKCLNEKSVDTVKNACSVLASLKNAFPDEIDIDDAESCIDGAKVSDKQLEALSRRIEKAKDGELDSVRSELIRWASANPSKCEKIADPITRIAKRQIREEKSLETYDTAIATVDEALSDVDCDGRKSSKKALEAKLDPARKGLVLSRLNLLAKDVNRDNDVFQEQYQTTSSEIMNQIYSACYAGQTASCNTAQLAMKDLTTVRNEYQMSDLRAYQSRLAFQQMMQGFQGGAPGQPGPANPIGAQNSLMFGQSQMQNPMQNPMQNFAPSPLLTQQAYPQMAQGNGFNTTPQFSPLPVYR